MVRKKINKKGAIEDFGEMLIGGIIILIILLLLSLYARSLEDKAASKPSFSVNQLDALKSTRVILDWEFDDGEKVYQRLIRACNNQANKKSYGVSEFKQDLNKLLLEKIPGGSEIEFMIFINSKSACSTSLDEEYMVPVSSRFQYNVVGNIKYLPKVIVPNPQGKDLFFLAKPVRKIDRGSGYIATVESTFKTPEVSNTGVGLYG